MPPANPTPETQAERKARQLAMLRRIAERAMALAEQAADDAEAAPRDADPKPDHHLNFTRHARTVRIVIALERNLDADPARATRYRAAAPFGLASVHNDPRHAPLRRVLQKEARKHPNPAQLCAPSTTASARNSPTTPTSRSPSPKSSSPSATNSASTRTSPTSPTKSSSTNPPAHPEDREGEIENALR